MGYSQRECNRIYYIALMHDCGKISIPVDILRKPGKLTDEEYEMIKNHTVYGDGIVISINKDLATIAFSHQVGIKTIVKTHKNLSKILYFE